MMGSDDDTIAHCWTSLSHRNTEHRDKGEIEDGID